MKDASNSPGTEFANLEVPASVRRLSEFLERFQRPILGIESQSPQAIGIVGLRSLEFAQGILDPVSESAFTRSQMITTREIVSFITWMREWDRRRIELFYSLSKQEGSIAEQPTVKLSSVRAVASQGSTTPHQSVRVSEVRSTTRPTGDSAGAPSAWVTLPKSDTKREWNPVGPRTRVVRPDSTLEDPVTRPRTAGLASRLGWAAGMNTASFAMGASYGASPMHPATLQAISNDPSTKTIFLDRYHLSREYIFSERTIESVRASGPMEGKPSSIEAKPLQSGGHISPPPIESSPKVNTPQYSETAAGANSTQQRDSVSEIYPAPLETRPHWRGRNDAWDIIPKVAVAAIIIGAIAQKLRTSKRHTGKPNRDGIDEQAELEEAVASSSALGQIRPEMGQVTLIAPPIRVGGEATENAGAALELDWSQIAGGINELDEDGLERLKSMLPEGSQLIYPAIKVPSRSGRAANLRLAAPLLAKLLDAGYGGAGRSQSSSISSRARQDSPPANHTGALKGRIVPHKRPSSGTKGVLGSANDADTMALAGQGQSRRTRALDFLGLPVRLAPSLSGNSDLADEVAARSGQTRSPSGSILRPQVLAPIQQRLFPSFQSVEAEPDKAAWKKAAPEFGLRSDDARTVLAPDSKVHIPSPAQPMPALLGSFRSPESEPVHSSTATTSTPQFRPPSTKEFGQDHTPIDRLDSRSRELRIRGASRFNVERDSASQSIRPSVNEPRLEDSWIPPIARVMRGARGHLGDMMTIAPATQSSVGSLAWGSGLQESAPITSPFGNVGLVPGTGAKHFGVSSVIPHRPSSSFGTPLQDYSDLGPTIGKQELKSVPLRSQLRNEPEFNDTTFAEPRPFERPSIEIPKRAEMNNRRGAPLRSSLPIGNNFRRLEPEASEPTEPFHPSNGPIETQGAYSTTPQMTFRPLSPVQGPAQPVQASLSIPETPAHADSPSPVLARDSMKRGKTDTEAPNSASEVALMANEVYAILKRRLGAERDRMGRW